MDNLPIEIVRKIYDYDDTFKIEFDKVLKQLKCYCFIYRCNECLKAYNKCYCYCVACRTYSRLCKQIYFHPNDMEEDELENVIALNQLSHLFVKFLFLTNI